MKSIENEDPLMEKIRESADLIRYLCANTDTYGPDAWSKGQLFQMLDEISGEADEIVRLTGIADLDHHYEEVWERLGEERNAVGGNGFDENYRPYTQQEQG